MRRHPGSRPGRSRLPLMPGPTATTSSIRLGRAAVRRAEPHEELDVAARARAAGWRSPRPRPAPASAAAAATSSTASARSAGSRTTPPAPTRSLPDLELRLHHQRRSPSGAVHAASAGSTSRSEMNDRSADGQVDRSADQLRGQRAHVGALEHRHPLVGAQRPGQLAVADVDRDHLRRRRRAAARR